MNTGSVKFGVFRRSSMGKFFVAVLTLGLMPQLAMAKTTDAQFYQYIDGICQSSVLPNGWDQTKVLAMCTEFLLGGPAGGVVPPASVSSNLGTANAGSGVSSRKNKSVRDLEEEQKKKSEKAASADGGGWGFLVTPQYGKTTRADTDLENGYHSTLSGLLVGVDYRFSDRFVLGSTIAQLKDDATFLGNAGSLKTSNNLLTLYGTWIPVENYSFDGYFGYGKINFDSRRFASLGRITGATLGSTTGNQFMAGVSTSYQKEFGQVNFAPFFNLDYIKTSIRGYSETGSANTCIDSFGASFSCGSDLIALRYGDRKISSLTSSLGARLGRSFTYGWGMLIPSVHLSAVHEFQNRIRTISNELVTTPGTGMTVSTDAPDRNYLLSGLGVVGAFNNGAQLFLDFEKRSQDRLLNHWALSAGLLIGF